MATGRVGKVRLKYQMWWVGAAGPWRREASRVLRLRFSETRGNQLKAGME